MLTRRPILTHIFFFLLFIIIPAIVFVRMPGESTFTVTRVLIQDTIGNFILLGFFYLNYYVFIPRFFFRHRYVLYIVFVVLFLCIMFPLPHLITDWFQPAKRGFPPLPRPGPGPHPFAGKMPPQHPPFFSFSLDDFRRHLYLFFTAIFFSFLLRTREHLSAIKEEKLHSELSLLKAQINPHFLFNTLNSIYALSVKKDDRASDAIVHLSGLMRYVTSDANDNKIPLQKESDYITNYIELQKARLGNTVRVDFHISGMAGNKMITPLILITYIENAFKYGVNPDVTGCVVNIRLDITDTGILLHTFNKKVPNLNRVESTGIGLKNTNERLKYLYPQKHDLKVSDNGSGYSVILSIELI